MCEKDFRPILVVPFSHFVAGASGTGKSTLLLNMIMQDIEAGQGVGVLDPHGDLVQAVLRRVPGSRANEVVLFDPTDQEYPFALNILEAKDQAEQERIAAETVAALQRNFSDSWGPRLERILTYALHTAMHAIRGATLADVERLLLDEPFRQQVLARVTDPLLLQFWRHEFTAEFQAFMNLSVGFDRILSEARKYRLVLAGLANQYVAQLTGPVRQAIFGNVGTMLVFRLGVDDAHTVAREMGMFTAQELLNLDVGQAIVRAGRAETAFNIDTYPAPNPPPDDPTPRIVARMRQRYARPRRDVEKELEPLALGPTGPSSPPPHPAQPPPASAQSKGRNRPGRPPTSDPSEDDLVT